MAYLTDGKLGADLTKVSTSPDHVVGTRAMGNDASEWMYVKATSAISQYDAVLINESTTANAVPITTTNAAASAAGALGFAQVAIASASYGWVARQGHNLSMKVSANCAPGVDLYTTANPGELDDTVLSAVGAMCQGVQTITTISNATAVGIIAVYPQRITNTAP